MEFERRTYFEDDDLHLYLENINDQVFIHIVLNKFSKSIFKKMMQKWGEVVLKMYNLGYEELFTYTKDNRVVKLVGGAELIGKHEGYEVYRWELD